MNNNKPLIRFKGFENNWECFKIGDIGEVITGSTPPTGDSSFYNGEYLFVSPADIQQNRYIEYTNIRLSAKGFSKGRILKEDSILFVSIGSTIGKVAQIKEKATTNQQINAITPNAEFDPNFVFSLLVNKALTIKQLAATQAVPIINKTSFTKIEVSLTRSLIEQTQIGNFFQNLDQLISLHQKRYDKLVILKKAMLEKMFPKPGAKVPEIRFKGFEGEWEEKTINNLGDIVTGSTPQTSDSSNYDGNFLFVSPADINSNRYIDSTLTTLTEKGFKKGRILKRGSTLFVSIGSTIGKVGQVNKEVTSNQQINAIVPFDGYDEDFVFTLLENISGKIKKLAATQAVPIINKTSFSKVEILISQNPEEQQKIGNYFQNLDNLISQNQKQLEKLKNIKKACLEKMFV